MVNAWVYGGCRICLIDVARSAYSRDHAFVRFKPWFEVAFLATIAKFSALTPFCPRQA